MLYRLSYFREQAFQINFYKKSGNAAIAIMSQHFRLIYICGERWIRTTVGVRQQIYSLPHLATLVSPQYFNS